MDFVLSWEQIWGGVITAVVGCLIKIVFSYLKEQREQHIKEQQQKDDIIQMLINNNKELMNWRSSIEDRHKEIDTKLENISSVVHSITHSDLILLKDRIMNVCRRAIADGHISIGTREDIVEMYECYKSMGGNGTGKLIYDETMKLPVSDFEKHE